MTYLVPWFLVEDKIFNLLQYIGNESLTWFLVEAKISNLLPYSGNESLTWFLVEAKISNLLPYSGNESLTWFLVEAKILNLLPYSGNKSLTWFPWKLKSFDILFFTLLFLFNMKCVNLIILASCVLLLKTLWADSTFILTFYLHLTAKYYLGVSTYNWHIFWE